ncbi:MAG: hypothetical protein IPK19_15645 [Chloroflexi bacterium]|nr:hypothetical protein [Chloroflexota bacterium]
MFHALYDQVLTVSRDRALDEEFRTAIEAAMIPVWTDGLRYTLYGWKNE